MPEQSEGNNQTSKINVFLVSHTIFFLLGDQKTDLFAPYGAIKSTLWPASRKNNLKNIYLIYKIRKDHQWNQVRIGNWVGDWQLSIGLKVDSCMDRRICYHDMPKKKHIHHRRYIPVSGIYHKDFPEIHLGSNNWLYDIHPIHIVRLVHTELLSRCRYIHCWCKSARVDIRYCCGIQL